MYEELKNGERSVGKTLLHCTKDQLWRYCEALNYIDKEDKVLDLGCGCGYGSYILSHKAKKVTGIDNCKGIIEYAITYYKKNNIEFICKNGLEITGRYDKIIAFESIEHFENTERLFRTFENLNAKKIILSVPHISVINRNKFHYRHFSEEEIMNYLIDINYYIEKMELVRFAGGLAIFCVANRIKEEE